MASSAPLVENNSQTNRARNRRVEIAIEQGKRKNLLRSGSHGSGF